ncbi:LUD domain-containing protein [Olivibacter sp. SDN3]|uniref:LutC/YkgG family protein n=1 Tax=Olivibacter sp. SDN3 TaxID=2764720 RepID=UPI0016518BCD|nr:LUD domain-containing protein [Olivibacter sp. SDN3]QNL50803.1 LUD domain-containing protein [Olivibacter sp. SDN3]
MEEATAKERMLKKIRKALLTKRDNPYPNLEELPLYKETEETLEVLFAKNFTTVAGNFVFCDDEIQLIENLLAIVEKEHARRIYAWEKSMQELLDRYEFPYFKSDADFINAQIGITACEALIARTGSILVTNGNASGRRMSIYPHVHIVIAYTSQVVMDLKDGFNIVREKYADSLPSMISTITGPSRTADIEKTLVLGAHGPKQLYLLLMDDGIYDE